MALLSALAVYKDLAPGYRIRQLTEKEEGEKVRDEVKRLREGEKMLVRSYKGYLKLMETEIKSKSTLLARYVDSGKQYGPSGRGDIRERQIANTRREDPAGKPESQVHVRPAERVDAFQLFGKHHGCAGGTIGPKVLGCCTSPSRIRPGSPYLTSAVKVTSADQAGL